MVDVPPISSASLGDGCLESTLADVTPRADDIRPDLDLDMRAHVLDDRPLSWRT